MKKGKGEGDGALPYEKTNRTPHPSAESTIHHPSQLKHGRTDATPSLPPPSRSTRRSLAHLPLSYIKATRGCGGKREGPTSPRIPAIPQPREISPKHDKTRQKSTITTTTTPTITPLCPFSVIGLLLLPTSKCRSSRLSQAPQSWRPHHLHSLRCSRSSEHAMASSRGVFVCDYILIYVEFSMVSK